MSGGSWDHTYMRLDAVSDALRADKSLDGSSPDLTPRQKASRHKLARLVDTLSAAMKAVEMVDSADMSTPVDAEAIDAVFDLLAQEPRIEVRRNDTGALDEIVAKQASIHMEDMGSCWSIILDAGTSHVNISFGGRLRRPLIVEQFGPVATRTQNS